MKIGKIGSSFDDFPRRDGIYEGVAAPAIKRVLARQLDALMRREDISKTELASRMHASRAQLDRLLDPENESVTLGSLARAAKAVGRSLRMELVRHRLRKPTDVSPPPASAEVVHRHDFERPILVRNTFDYALKLGR